jgi:serine/threonine protein kinase
MNDSIFKGHVNENLIEKIHDYRDFTEKEIIYEGALYVYKGEKSSMAQLRKAILTKDGLFIANNKKQDEQKKLFVSVKINTKWSMVYFLKASKIENERKLPFPFQISFVFDDKVAHFYHVSKLNFKNWQSVLEKVGIQTNFGWKYSMDRKIGKGGTASVYRIIKKENDSVFACKVFKKSRLLKNKVALKNLMNEIRILIDVKGHPNIVAYEEIHDFEEKIYLVTELIEGKKIFHTNIKFLPNEICTIIESLLSALVFLTEKGIVHRDIKPDNLLLKYSNREINENEIKIIDFGLAIYSTNESQSFHRCGTIGYLAPEMMSDKIETNTTFSIDIYSLGIVLYNFLTESKAFRCETTDKGHKKTQVGAVNYNHPKFENTTPCCKLKSQRLHWTDVNNQPGKANIRNRSSYARLLHCK